MDTLQLASSSKRNDGSENAYINGEIMKRLKTGCGGSPTTIVSGEFSPFLIAVDDTSVYWTRISSPGAGVLTPSTSIIKATAK